MHLPRISCRSPLAAWKALVHAIACFHRGEDEPCLKWLRAIAPDSVPARLVSPMQAMLGSAPVSACSPSAARLATAAGSSHQLLQSALAGLERALEKKKKKPIFEAARAAVNLCRGNYLGEVEKLRKHIAVRCMLLDFEPRKVFAAIGKYREDAYWFRLLARGIEECKGAGHYAEALFSWENFATSRSRY